MAKKFFIYFACPFALLVFFMYFIFKNTPEHYQHNMRGENNSVYVHKDGHSEVVFDQNGKMVKECMNMGSYNYADRMKSPFLHFFQDRLPWVIWGNCKDDPTTVTERVSAFSKDLLLGLKVTVGLVK